MVLFSPLIVVFDGTRDSSGTVSRAARPVSSLLLAEKARRVLIE
jgi:hypothetical protein